jgi:hypothetical protein
VSLEHSPARQSKKNGKAKRASSAKQRSVSPGFTDRWLNQDEAAALLGVSPRVLEQDVVRKYHKIPYYKWGPAMRRYRLSELLAWAAERRVG